MRFESSPLACMPSIVGNSDSRLIGNRSESKLTEDALISKYGVVRGGGQSLQIDLRIALEPRTMGPVRTPLHRRLSIRDPLGRLELFWVMTKIR